MVKFLMLSILVATVAIPAFAAREKRPAKALRHMVFGVVLFSLAYLLVVMFATPSVSLE